MLTMLKSYLFKVKEIEEILPVLSFLIFWIFP